MGAERWLWLKSSKEADSCRKFLGQTTFIGLEDSYGCWLDWRSPLVLEVGYQAHNLSQVCADLVSREITKRFGIRTIGHDSVGWYKGIPSGRRQRKASSWTEWMKTFNPEQDVRWFEDEEPSLWKSMEHLVIETFQKLDDLHSSSKK